MRIELWAIFITIGLLYHIYTDGKYLENIFFQREKYFKMVSVLFVMLSLYVMLKYNPIRYKNTLLTATNALKYLPPLKTEPTQVPPTPVQDFKHLQGQYVPQPLFYSSNDPKISSHTSTKRSVSETKKKIVASSQQWACKNCKSQLNAWFEVDHIMRLDKGGTNDVSNLVALCRECHGCKTAMENM